MSPRRLRLTAIAVTMVALAVAAPVWAQSADDLEEVEDQQEELNEQLDVLQADYEELEAALEATTTRVPWPTAARSTASVVPTLFWMVSAGRRTALNTPTVAARW